MMNELAMLVLLVADQRTGSVGPPRSTIQNQQIAADDHQVSQPSESTGQPRVNPGRLMRIPQAEDMRTSGFTCGYIAQVAVKEFVIPVGVVTEATLPFSVKTLTFGPFDSQADAATAAASMVKEGAALTTIRFGSFYPPHAVLHAIAGQGCVPKED